MNSLQYKLWKHKQRFDCIRTHTFGAIEGSVARIFVIEF